MAKKDKNPKPSKDYIKLKEKMNLKNMIKIFKNSNDTKSKLVARKYFDDNILEFNENELIYIIRNSKHLPNNLLNKIDITKLQLNQIRVITKYKEEVDTNLLKEIKKLVLEETFNVEDYY